MAQKTALSNSALPGPLHVFLAKEAALVLTVRPPRGRSYAVPRHERTYSVAQGDRHYNVARHNRTYKVEDEE